MHSTYALNQRFRRFLPVVVDVETGGMDYQHAPIVEIALTFLTIKKGQLVLDDDLYFHIKPFEGAIVEPNSLEFLGYDAATLATHPITESEAFEMICHQVNKRVHTENCTRAIIVGHNAHFDLAFINSAIKRHQLKSPFHRFSTLDTASLSALLLGHTVLCQACRLAGIEWDNKCAHNALYDCQKTATLFCQLVNQSKELYIHNIAG